MRFIAATVINAAARCAQTLRWMLITAWRQVNGRFYFFRDCPDWFVAEASSLPVGPGDDDWYTAYVMAARQEMRLRLDLLVREAEKAIEAAQQGGNAS